MKHIDFGMHSRTPGKICIGRCREYVESESGDCGCASAKSQSFSAGMRDDLSRLTALSHVRPSQKLIINTEAIDSLAWLSGTLDLHQTQKLENSWFEQRDFLRSAEATIASGFY
jgi:hypothetical protein